MIVLDAVWELRNLGLNVKEIVVQDDDHFDNLLRLENSINCDYSVVKVPTNNIALLRRIESLGYKFIEVLTKVSVQSIPTLTGPHKRLFNLLSTGEAGEEEKAIIFENIKAGMFSTDRVSVDSNFTKEQAANRYLGLIEDVVSAEGDLRSIYLKDEFIGFFLGQMGSNKIYNSLLAGVFEQCNKLGVGSYINHLAYEYAFSRNCRAVNTVFSSNNLSASAIHYSLNCRLIMQQYVLVKHHKEKD